MNDLRTPIVYSPAPSDRDDERDDKPVRPRRTTERGPVGFGAVLRDVKGARSGSRRDGGGDVRVAIDAGGTGAAEREEAAAKPESARGGTKDAAAGRAPAAQAAMAATPSQAPARRERAAEGGSGAAAGPAEGGSNSGATAQAGAATHGGAPAGAAGHAGADAMPAEGTDATEEARRSQRGERARELGRMRVQDAMRRVLDEATRLEIRESLREIKIELEPEHLGPLVVRLRRDGDRVDVAFRVREARAAQAIGAEREALAARLRDAGMADPRITLAEDATLDLDAG